MVTANKDVVAKHGTELLRTAGEHGGSLYFEAAVAGGIPIIKAISEALVGNRIDMLMGIINGTTNYMLTKMTQEGAAFGDVLREAQARGYAEADPSSDVEGHDAAYKIAILASLAFETEIAVDAVYREGITHHAGGHPQRRGARLRGEAPCHRQAERGARRGARASNVYSGKATRWRRSTMRSTLSSSTVTPSAN